MAYTIQQQLMTLAALAPTGAIERPSGETLTQQAERIATGIAAQLARPDLATAGEWSLGWLGLSDDRANLAYLANGPTGIALVIRGTVVGSAIDRAEDLDVGTVVPFPLGVPSSHVSLGASDGAGEIVGLSDPRSGISLEDALGMPADRLLYVAGHSLGGALTTVLASTLHRYGWSVEAHTFAAPTAGDAGFAAWFDANVTAYRTYGAYDVIPYAWQDLVTPQGWYPAPGPYADGAVRDALQRLDDLRDGNVYVQPSANVDVLNTGYGTRCTPSSSEALDAFLEEVGFQHDHNTYLTLLGAPVVPDPPDVTGLSPRAGWPHGGATVTVTGTGFTPDCVVDFGATAAGATTYVSPTELTTTSPPLPIGAHVVRVTNDVGTSAELDASAVFVVA